LDQPLQDDDAIGEFAFLVGREKVDDGRRIVGHVEWNRVHQPARPQRHLEVVTRFRGGEQVVDRCRPDRAQAGRRRLPVVEVLGAESGDQLGNRRVRLRARCARHAARKRGEGHGCRQQQWAGDPGLPSAAVAKGLERDGDARAPGAATDRGGGVSTGRGTA
jgi:hypothetical protein